MITNIRPSIDVIRLEYTFINERAVKNE